MTVTDMQATNIVDGVTLSERVRIEIAEYYYISNRAGRTVGAPVTDTLKLLWARQDSNGLSTLVFPADPDAPRVRVFREEIDGCWIFEYENSDLNGKEYEHCFSTLAEAFEHACFEIDICGGQSITVEFISRPSGACDVHSDTASIFDMNQAH